MADVTVELVWFRLKEFAAETYEIVQHMDVVDLWFFGWMGISLLGILVVHLLTSSKRRTRANDPAAL